MTIHLTPQERRAINSAIKRGPAKPGEHMFTTWTETLSGTHNWDLMDDEHKAAWARLEELFEHRDED